LAVCRLIKKFKKACLKSQLNFRGNTQYLTYEQKAQVYGRLFDAERLCNEGKTEKEKKALEDATGLIDLDEVFKDTGQKN